MSNKKYKKCFCVEEIDDINNVDIDPSLVNNDINEDIDDISDEDLMKRLAKLKEPTRTDTSKTESKNTLIDLPVNTNIPPSLTEEEKNKQNYLQGGYQRTKNKGESLVRSYSYKSKKGGKRMTVKHNKKRKTVKNYKKRKTNKHNKKGKSNKNHTMKKKKFNKK